MFHNTHIDSFIQQKEINKGKGKKAQMTYL